MTGHKDGVPGVTGNDLLDDDSAESFTEDEVKYGVPVARTARLLGGISRAYVRQLWADGKLVRADKRGHYTVKSIVRERDRRKALRLHASAEA